MNQTNKSKRKLRLGVVGGGPDSFIGPVHRIAARMSDHYDLTAAVLSSDPEKSVRYAADLGIDRAYADWQGMISQERNREDGVEVIAVMTPNDTHYPIAMAALDADMHVISDKPLCIELEDALDLVKKTQSTGKVLCVTYNYSAYPMVRQAEAMVRKGDIGEIRQVHLQYIQGYLADSTDEPGWRGDPIKGGPSLVTCDIATHAYHLGCYVTGLEVEELMADIGTSMPGRTIDDYMGCLLNFENGAKGSMWITNAAAGAEHGLSFKIFGEKGGLEWHQENPNELRHRRLDGFEQILTRRKDGQLYPEAERAMSLVIGHPEGYHDAFANLYKDVAETILAREKDPGFAGHDFPSVWDGAKGVNFIHAAIASSRNKAWENCRLSLTI